jgi:hypothetical protein
MVTFARWFASSTQAPRKSSNSNNVRSNYSDYVKSNYPHNEAAFVRISNIHDSMTEEYAIEPYTSSAHTYADIFYCAQELHYRLHSADPLSFSTEELTRISAELRQIIALQQSLRLREKVSPLSPSPSRE